MAIELFTLNETPSMANFNKRIEQANQMAPKGIIAMWGGGCRHSRRLGDVRWSERNA